MAEEVSFMGRLIKGFLNCKGLYFIINEFKMEG